MDAASAARAEPSLTASGADPAETYSAALDRWLASGAADLDERLPVVLADLGLDLGGAPEQALMTSLSGGQAARVGLAALLLSRFHIALLAHPTNTLDHAGLERLQAPVRGLPGGG